MGEIGNFFGWVIIVCYGLAIINYVVKFISKKFSKIIKKNDTVKKYFNILLKLVVKYHKIFGFLTILFISIHFAIQYFTRGIKVSGIVALLMMLIQIIGGIYGTKIKKRSKLWLYSHRIVAIITGVAIIVHIL